MGIDLKLGRQEYRSVLCVFARVCMQKCLSLFVSVPFGTCLSSTILL